MTILFCDVVGSTALGERADPETVRRVLGRVFGMARPVIEKHGGVVEKFIGDAVMAVFGLPVAHEDDALRAVRAADDIIHGLDSLNRDFERQWGVTIQLRTGITTGEVATGDPRSDEIFATGDAVNVAARLEQAAEPMAIVIGERTRHLTEGYVETEPLEPLSLKGKSEPVAAFRVVSISGDEGRPASATMQGRDAEALWLRDSLAAAVHERRCRLATILGEAGVGKTRLVAEFIHDLPDGTLLLRGRCLSYGEGIAYWPIAEAIGDFAGLGDLDSTAALARVHELAGDSADAGEIARVIADLTGIRDSVVEAHQVRWAVRRMVEELSAVTPLVLLVDDLQWAEEPLLELLSDLVARVRTGGMLVVCNARPELLENHAEWETGEGRGLLRLGPLGPQACDRVVAELLGGDVEDDVLEYVNRAAKGNPLFVEEVVSMLVRDGAIEEAPTEWVLRAGFDDLPVPPSIQSVLDARLDALDESDRDVLERASVVGEVFYASALGALLPAGRREDLGGRLAALEATGLVEPAVSDMPGEPAFKFHHILLRDVAERRLRKSDSAYLHERFAEWLEPRAAASPRLAEIVGYHLEAAHDRLAELGPADERALELGRRASVHLAAAARRSWDRGSDLAAGALYRRAARLLPSDPAGRARRLIDAAKAYVEIDSQAAQACAGEAAKACRAAGCRALELLADAMMMDSESFSSPKAGTGRAALDAFNAAIDALEREDDPQSLCWAYITAGYVSLSLGFTGSTAELGERAARLASEFGLHRELGMATGQVIGFYVPGNRTVAQCIRRAEEALAHADGDLAVETFGSSQLIVHLARAGRLEEARSRSDEAIAQLEEIGADTYVPLQWQSRSAVELYAERWEAAEHFERKSIGFFESIGMKGLQSNPLAELSWGLLESGRLAEAAESARRALRLTEADDLYPVAIATWVLALLAAKDGAVNDALASLDDIARRLAIVDLPELGADVEFVRARALLEGDREAEAIEALTKVTDVYDRLGVVVSADRARRMLSGLTGA